MDGSRPEQLNRTDEEIAADAKLLRKYLGMEVPDEVLRNPDMVEAIHTVRVTIEKVWREKARDC